MANPLKSIGSILAGIAPTLATAVAGPAGGAVARIAVGALGDALELPKDKRDAASVEAALSAASPDQLLALRSADRAFETRMRELDIDVARLHQADRASARTMQERTRSWVPAALSFVLAAMFAAAVGGTLVVAVHPGLTMQSDLQIIIGSLLGVLGTSFTAVISFWFGSSTAGERAAEHMGEAVRTNGGGR